MTDITIPPAALEAARNAYVKHWTWRDAVDAACLAMLKAWPGATTRGPHSSGHGPTREQLILPLPQKGGK